MQVPAGKPAAGTDNSKAVRPLGEADLATQHLERSNTHTHTACTVCQQIEEEGRELRCFTER